MDFAEGLGGELLAHFAVECEQTNVIASVNPKCQTY